MNKRGVTLRTGFSCVLCCFFQFLTAQDSVLTIDNKAVTLKEVVVRNNINIPAFMKRVQDDTTFYKAFRNLKILGYTSLNDISIMDKRGKVAASLNSRTIQHVSNGCRYTEIAKETTTGDMYNRNHELNYLTAQMYAGLFFAPDTICGETNIVQGASFSTKGKSGLSKHKEQLKMLFFNPGKKIPGIPFIGNRIALFDDEVAALYDFEIDMGSVRNNLCYIFRAKPRKDLSESEKNRIVINDITTWFDSKTWEIVARKYDLSYNAGVYDFNVHVEVEMTKFAGYLVPAVLKYNGNWDVVFKPRERAVFTATLFGFNR